MNPKLGSLIDALRAMPSREGLMNPYASGRAPDISAAHEEVGAEADDIRIANLTTYLTALLDEGSDVLMCGEAPSAVGTRWSGIAFTSERELAAAEHPLAGCCLLPGAEAGRRDLMQERSALHVWKALARAPVPAVLWNALQLHPHPVGDPRTNRTPSREEVALGQRSLERVIDLVRPRRVIALGRTAERALADLGVDATYVRHPAHGGSTRMMTMLEELGVIPSRLPDADGA